MTKRTDRAKKMLFITRHSVQLLYPIALRIAWVSNPLINLKIRWIALNRHPLAIIRDQLRNLTLATPAIFDLSVMKRIDVTGV